MTEEIPELIHFEPVVNLAHSPPVDLERLFTAGTTFYDAANPEWARRMECLVEADAGEISLPSGKVCISLPEELNDRITLDTLVEPGTYPVDVVKYFYPAGDRPAKIAALRIRLRSGDPVRWVMACPEGDSLDDLMAFQSFGPVPDGMFGISDGDQTDLYLKSLDEQGLDPFESFYLETYLEEQTDGLQSTSIGDENAPKYLGVNVTEGGVMGYWGIDSNGDTVSLVIDLNLFADKVHGATDFGALSEWSGKILELKILDRFEENVRYDFDPGDPTKVTRTYWASNDMEKKILGRYGYPKLLRGETELEPKTTTFLGPHEDEMDRLLGKPGPDHRIDELIFEEPLTGHERIVIRHQTGLRSVPIVKS